MFPEKKELAMFNILVAASENDAIGKDNRLLWHLPNDLKHFKQLSVGHTVIMGRKTYDSIGKPLPNRRNIIVSRQSNLIIAGCEVVNTLEQAINLSRKDGEVFIIGGGDIYRQAMIFCDTIYITRVHHHFEADTYFQPIDLNIWVEKEREYHPADAKHDFPYSFITYLRK